MAEIIQKDGTWTFDGETVRVVPGSDKAVGLLRRTLGELAVPLEALAGVSFEPGKKSGRLRLRLRNGADPLLQITGSNLPDGSDPYQLAVEADRTGTAEYFVDAVRQALMLEQVSADPADRYLLPGPSLPITVGAGDGTIAFDGEQIKLTWNWKTQESKASGGPRTIAVEDVEAVEWLPSSGLDSGYLRFTVTRSATTAPPKYDPHAVELWGFRKDPLMALVAAAVVARLPHPYGGARSGPAAVLPAAPRSADAPAGAEDPDALLRRLRELGELHRSGILTDEEFSTAKQAILARL
ncbi:DUF4429 domain-containing protein [Streptomyces yaizuensis]|uniref:DUF4429 domain-containing protein n=1 Tax=Streptomyces yaizuensis TaxID=2989713 RepID=A0ABQ5NT72_9ACTN|nr:DUF4429 domain-containing protein [Streptomyces sp. YSPA8]GLF93571.1 DUF4429 domain-containing protein [Streptomyces sp. YSPA8]